MEQTRQESRIPGSRGLVVSASIGTVILIFTFISLYRTERTASRSWQVKKAERIDPAHPSGARGMVKFTGLPSGDLINDALTGKTFVFLNKKSYEYRMVQKTRLNAVSKNGVSHPAPATYIEGEWVPVKDEEFMAEQPVVGTLTLRIREAELLGKHDWRTTIFEPAAAGTSSPAPGYKKYEVSGIPSNIPLFCAGKLNGTYLESGTVFIVSAYSEDKTIDSIRESGWIRNFFTFIFLLTGFIVISHPVMFLLKKFRGHPTAGFLSKMGWGMFISFSAAGAYLVVKYRSVAADLIWVLPAAAVVILALAIAKKIRSKV